MESGLKSLNKYSFSSKAATTKINKILTSLSEKPLCRHDIAELIHSNYRHAKNYIDYLLAEKKIYISKWCLEHKGDRTMFWPYYQIGDKKSKPKPPNLTQAQKCKRYRKKLSTDEDRLDRIKSKRRNRRQVIKPDWTAAWMMASNTTQEKDAGA